MSTTSAASIPIEKLDQAVAILDEHDVDCWLTFVRETAESGDPVLPLILGQPLTWQSALLVTRTGERIAIVGKYEDEAVAATGAWPEIVTYVQGISGPLVEILTRLDPQRIAINYSENDVKADGLTHGMHALLRKHLAGAPYADRLESAEAIIGALRARKTPTEIARIEKAIALTDEVFFATAVYARRGVTEAAISAFMHAEARARGADLAWEPAMCPIVTTGPDSMVGHGLPSETLAVTPGHVFHLDFGLRVDDYCSDIQRCWYVPADGRVEPSAEITRAFDTVLAAIRAAAAMLAPGVAGWEVDAAAREVVLAAGYPEYQHATGHHVGRAAHDGAGVLGPRWEHYGRTPFYEAEPGHVYTLELGVDTPGGYLGLEEMVVVTADGCRWLSTPQIALPIL